MIDLIHFLPTGVFRKSVLLLYIVTLKINYIAFLERRNRLRILAQKRQVLFFCIQVAKGGSVRKSHESGSEGSTIPYL